MKCGQSMTPRTSALIEEMLCADGIPECREWVQLEAHARQLESSLAEAVAALQEHFEVVDEWGRGVRDEKAMLRLDNAHKAARAIIAKHSGVGS